MERTYELEKFSGGIKKWKKKYIIISKDEISYSNINDKNNIINKFHFSLIKKNFNCSKYNKTFFTNRN